MAVKRETTIMNGNDVVEANLIELKSKVKEGTCAVVIQVGDNQASTVYVNNKLKMCEQLGIECKKMILHETITTEELLNIINLCNKNEHIHGILVQLPLPSHIDDSVIAESIVWYKDIDCFNPYNLGQVMLGNERIAPCTPRGIFRILEHYGLEDVRGKRVVIVGRSNIVGKPLANMFINRGATVVSCNSNTPFEDIFNLIYGSDIFVSAIGKANFFNADSMSVEDFRGYICPIGIDVGINRDEDNKLCGDISRDIQECFEYITPVPRGVGRTTVLQLMYNIIECREIQEEMKNGK